MTGSEKNALLDAAALQDHYARSYQMKSKLQIYSMKPQLSTTEQVKNIATEEHSHPKESNLPNIRKPNWNFKPKKGGKIILEKLNYQDIIGKNMKIIETNFEKEKEMKIRKIMKGMTLAQKRGLVARPELPLTVEEWKNVMVRAKDRLQNECRCPICMDDFKLNPQVVLSCSHYFHKDCIESFEKHSGTKKCPICRAENYEKNTFFEGSKLFIHTRACKIQALLRQYICRREFYNQLIDRNYTPENKELRSKVLEYKMSRVVQKMSHYMQNKKKLIQQAITGSQEMVSNHESLMRRYEENVEKILRKRNDEVRARLELEAEQENRDWGTSRDLNPTMWAVVTKKADERKAICCSICLGDLNPAKPLLLTSCAHVFHSACLASFEAFTHHKPYNCPNCRHPYECTPYIK